VGLSYIENLSPHQDFLSCRDVDFPSTSVKMRTEALRFTLAKRIIYFYNLNLVHGQAVNKLFTPSNFFIFLIDFMTYQHVHQLGWIMMDTEVNPNTSLVWRTFRHDKTQKILVWRTFKRNMTLKILVHNYIHCTNVYIHCTKLCFSWFSARSRFLQDLEALYFRYKI